MCPEDELWLIPKQRLAIKPPFEPRSHFKMDLKSGLSMIVRRVIVVSLLTISSRCRRRTHQTSVFKYYLRAANYKEQWRLT